MTFKQARKLFSSFDSPEAFADWCFPTANSGDTHRSFFRVIGWNEGYRYCCESREYAIKTGYRCVENAITNETMHRAYWH